MNRKDTPQEHLPVSPRRIQRLTQVNRLFHRLLNRWIAQHTTLFHHRRTRLPSENRCSILVWIVRYFERLNTRPKMDQISRVNGCSDRMIRSPLLIPIIFRGCLTFRMTFFTIWFLFSPRVHVYISIWYPPFPYTLQRVMSFWERKDQPRPVGLLPNVWSVAVVVLSP